MKMDVESNRSCLKSCWDVCITLNTVASRQGGVCIFPSSFHTFLVLSLSIAQFVKGKLVIFRGGEITLKLQQNRENSIQLKNTKLIQKENETDCYSLGIPALIQRGNPLVLSFLQIIPDKMELLSIFTS